jgi:hypothetical protein
MIAGGLLALLSTLPITVWDDAPRQDLVENENPSPIAWSGGQTKK